MVSSRCRRNQHGVATVFGLAMIALLVFVAAVGVGVNALITAHRGAQGAADLAALAGASAQVDGRDPCGVAAHIASANHAQLTSCTLGSASVAVQVSVKTMRLFGESHQLRARARAGQAGLGP